ncbi:unnamed protein product [Microthlaspi erraticum]|uniref:FBD domain-containing protein n=1 Tax=Microthlaspi erraticum TaxID=1685480 RepID=A0A6D2HEH7_9BRAS|nr:unnamed protein product [Microthlaspi erraticum]
MKLIVLGFSGILSRPVLSWKSWRLSCIGIILKSFMWSRVQSLSVKRLSLKLGKGDDKFEVEIDAHLLRFLKIHDSITKSYVIKNLDSIVKLDVSLGFGEDFDEASVSLKRHSIRRFLSGILKVAEMIPTKTKKHFLM